MVLIKMLAHELRLDRGFLLKKAKREGITTTKIPVMTLGGVQMCAAVPREYAKRLRELYAVARGNRVTC